MNPLLLNRLHRVMSDDGRNSRLSGFQRDTVARDNTVTYASAMGMQPRIAVKSNGGIRFLDLAAVHSVEAQGNYVLVLHRSGSHLLRESISEVSEKLALCGFVRIHRSVLVNPRFVEEIRPLSTGTYRLKICGGKEYNVTRTYKKNIKLLASSWIGANEFS